MLRNTPGLLLAGFLLGPAFISGCTTSSTVDMASTDVADTEMAFDLVLPDSVTVIPTLSDGTAVAALETTATGETDLATTASYAGPTPSAVPLAVTASAAPVAVTAPIDTTEPTAADEGARGEVERLIGEYAALYEVPVELVRRVVKRESNFFPGAYNNGHWGLMQIKHATARGMGYDGQARGLLDAETNLKYAVKYLRGAYLVANGDHDLAVRFYARGYYYDAKRKGLLDETGLGTDNRRRRI